MQTYNPVTNPIKAVQYTGSNPVEVIGVWLGRKLNAEDFSVEALDLLKDVLEEIKVSEGDYIALDKDGEVQFIKKAMFEQFYVPAGDVILS